MVNCIFLARGDNSIIYLRKSCVIDDDQIAMQSLHQTIPSNLQFYYYVNMIMMSEKFESLGSGGSMVASLKPKEIDGRIPQGLEHAA